MNGVKVSDLKKPELKTGGGGVDSSSECIMIEKADNGWILRIIDVAEETQELMVFQDRNDLMRELAKRV